MSECSAASTHPVKGLTAALLLAATAASAAPPVLRWNGPAAGTNVWNSAAANWLDDADAAVAWQPGATARFDGAGTPVDIAENVAATNLSFTGSGYTLSGPGLLTVEGTLSAAGSTDNTLAAELRSFAGLSKTGGGTLTLSHPNGLLTNPVAVSEGTLALQGVAIPGALVVSTQSVAAILPPASSGLMGYYYKTVPAGSAFASLTALEAHFSALTPEVIAPSGLAGASFDFGTGGSLFPLPFGAGGSQTNNFEVVWRGVLTVPASGYYTFRITHDDGILLALDNKTVASRLLNTVTDATSYLAAGPHDMVLGLYQGTGPSGMSIQIKTLYGDFMPLPNAWLKPYASVGALSGGGSVTLATGAALNVAQRAMTAFSGDLGAAADALFTKSGWGLLTLASSGAASNTVAGRVSVQGGVLALATAERIHDAATVAVADSSCLRLTADETLGGLAGEGTVTLGGGSSVFVASFSSDADSGLSTNKVYTHLLDFPDNANPATVNGVAFLSAGLSGSTNGYAWSTTGTLPPNSWNDAPNDSTRAGVDRLLWDFYYGGTDYTLTLSGLRPGQTYETRLYFRAFGSPNPNSPRKLHFFFNAGSAFIGSVFHNPDTMNRSWVSCRYTADRQGTLSARILSYNGAHTCHFYGLSNEETAPPAAPPPAAAWPRVVAFNNDADCGLTSAKTYTHALDFPSNGSPATVNGVAFASAGMSGAADGYAWNTTGLVPSGTWNSAPDDSTRTGIDRLLWDFQYNTTNFTVNLTGLHPGQVYEARLYFRSFGTPVSNSSRDIIATFTAGSAVLGSVPHDLDTMARSRIECRYKADASGSLAINIVSLSTGNTCHLYGLSNEEVNGLPGLTLDTPAGAAPLHTGAITGYGSLVKRGAGSQGLGGAVCLTTPIDVQAGTLDFVSGASALSGVVVRAGATAAAPNGNVFLGSLAGEGTFSLDGITPYPVTNLLYFVAFTNDAGTGLSSNKVYTHLLDFGTRAPAAVINGVAFNKVSSMNGSGFSNFPPSAHPGNAMDVSHGVPVGTGAYDLLYDMDYGWSWPAPVTMQLTGLTPGKRYEVRLYNRAWGWGGGRTQTLTFDPDSSGPITESVTFNPDAMNANFLAYRYTATSATMAITVQSAYSNQTYHLYGLSNEETADAAYTPVTVDIARDTVFPGLITGAGGWIKTGAGTLTLTATNDATGALAVSAGALCVAGGGTATLGPVSAASGTALFGEGRLGGDVTIASNAWLQAGSASACGTLTIGGDLTLEPGAQLAYRFGQAGSNDTILVSGHLTLAAGGTVQASSLVAGADAPTRDVFIATADAIDGPANLGGWSVEGVERASLKYSADRSAIYFIVTRGTLLHLR